MIIFPDHPAVTLSDLPPPTDFATFHPFIKGVFSQWHFTPFESDELSFTCAEQYMMAAKASLFGDHSVFAQIMASDDPALHKRLGAQVQPFDQDIWDAWRFHVVHQANFAKFSRNPGAARQLQNTAPAMLVEANPRDWNWGNGLQIEDTRNHDPAQWPGTNYLGRILTLVRESLAES